VSVAVGLAAFFVIHRWPQPDPALRASEAIGEELERHPPARTFLRSRMDPSTATGLLLTVALAGLVLSGAVVGVLVWMVRRDSGLVNVDRAVERWAEEHATTFTDDVLAGITHLGDTLTIIAVGVASLPTGSGVAEARHPAVRCVGRSRSDPDLEHDQGRHRSRPARAAPARGRPPWRRPEVNVASSVTMSRRRSL
jgi:hypothetical protein